MGRGDLIKSTKITSKKNRTTLTPTLDLFTPPVHARRSVVQGQTVHKIATRPANKGTKAPLPTMALGDAAPVNRVKFDEPVGAPVPEIVPDAAGAVFILLGIGNGTDEELGTMTAAEKLGAMIVVEELGTTCDEEMVVAAGDVDLRNGATVVVDIEAVEVVLPKSFGRVIPLAAAQSKGESPYEIGSVMLNKGGHDDLHWGSSIL